MVTALVYYLLVLAAATVIFFVLSAALGNSVNEPELFAGAAAVALIAACVILRELVVRRIQARRRAAEKLHAQLRGIEGKPRDKAPKLSISANTKLVDRIRTKSEAARVLSRAPDAHREVVGLCEQYLELASAELAAAKPGSPRLAALRKGIGTARRRHRSHMLAWVESSARIFASEQRSSADRSVALRHAEQALAVADRALAAYPAEVKISETHHVLSEFVASGRVGELLEEAHGHRSRGDLRAAATSFGKVLAALEDGSGILPDADVIRRSVQAELLEMSRIV